MAFHKLLYVVLAVVVVLALDENVHEKKEAVAAERTRSANPAGQKGSFNKLTSLLNRTESRRGSRRGKDNLNKIHQLNRQHDDMMNDNEGSVTTNLKQTPASNDTLFEKMKILRPSGSTYEAKHNNDYISKAQGVFCNFENDTSEEESHKCMWVWNTTVSSHGLGFNVMTPEDLVKMNETTKGMKFNGPSTDADGNVEGHFLYLPVDPTMENMVIKSPVFRGLWEFCKFEVNLHQSKMQNASIKLVSEAATGEVQWVLQEVAGNNFEAWHPLRFMIGKINQEVRIIVEISRPNYVSLAQPLPHIAIDNVRMIECVPEPPVFNGECVAGQVKCKIMMKDSCIKLSQICDLVKDCDDGSDETQNCDKMPYGSYCNFEQDNCGFEDVPQLILKWSRHSGPTPTDKTGPNYDHTCGPPTVRPTQLVPPLIPAHMNQTLSTCIGYYFFVNMNVTGPNKEKADFASTAVMKTVIFNPPPKVHGNSSSKYYNCCMIRFYYQQNGRNYGSLSVDVVEINTRSNTTTSLWFSTKDKGENWYRATIFLPNITRRYYLQFKTRMGMRIYSDSAIDDFSMAPECFGLNIDKKELGDYNYYDPVFEEKTTPHSDFVDKTFYRFTTCGSTGRHGPNQTMCDKAYNNTNVNVTVFTTAPYEGIQVWEVPAEGLYTIIAIGASGGLGSSWAGVSHGAAARIVLQLHRHEHIYMLVGQLGTNACKKTLSAGEGGSCVTTSGTSTVFTSKTHEVRNTHVEDGGGGGGGGTYVFVLDKDGQAVPLVVGGGGGGLSLGAFRDDGSQHARTHYNGTPVSGYMYGKPGKTAGSGGGWIPRPDPLTPGFEMVRGAAVREGGAGGSACVGVADGGFGGGGGGCVRGGGGGGWLGGNTNEGEGLHGGGGWSYVDGSRAIKEYSDVTIAARTGPGEVVIVPAIHACGCDYRCVATNEYRSEVRCYCPASWNTDYSDRKKCILGDNWPRTSWVLIIVLSVVAFVFLLAILGLCLYLYNLYQRKNEDQIRQKQIMEQEVQLHRLRLAPGSGEPPLSMAFNPHYGSESFMTVGIDVKELPQVSRESLKLVKALGQGAFGEVYQGLYRHRSNDAQELPVAVKTLPELSTTQAEHDFLMEAAIMSKFNHSNVVHMIGVCFDRHPRFIVLELLAGGDLKNFLRESRPKPERASALSMKDLLLCSLDVVRGCRYLEAKRFIHRDIAARNCLLSSRGPGRVVKIADFGMARDIYRADYYKKGGKALLPIKWMPPEAYIDGVFTIKTDVWSFGVLLWEVFSLGVMPYTGCTNREVMEMVSGGGRLEKPTGCPADVYRLMCECWAPAPSDRPAFALIYERIQLFLQDNSIVNTPLPIVRSHLPLPIGVSFPNGPQRVLSVACWQRDGGGDYLVPMSPQDPLQHNSPTDPLVLHSKSQTAAMDPEELEDSQYQHLLKVSQEYGNIPTPCPNDNAKRDVSVPAVLETKNNTKFLPSNSTDRLLSSIEGSSIDIETESDSDIPVGEEPVIWETSFTKTKKSTDGPIQVDKIITITPTTLKPPETFAKTVETKVIDKTNHKNSLVPEKKTAPIASPDPPRIHAKWNNEAPKLHPKPKPLCLDAAQLEQDLNALKKISGSVNLNNMNILPPYINVVTPNKLSESKTIQIDPKKAVIDDLPKENEPINEKEEKAKLKQSNSAASLLNGPMTDVPYADTSASDTTSTSSGSNQNIVNNQMNQNTQQNQYGEIILGNKEITKDITKEIKEITKQGSKSEFAESEISC